MAAFKKRRELADDRRTMRRETLERKRERRIAEDRSIEIKEANLQDLKRQKADQTQIAAAVNELEEARRKFQTHREQFGPPQPCDDVSEAEEEEEVPVPATIVPAPKPPSVRRPELYDYVHHEQAILVRPRHNIVEPMHGGGGIVIRHKVRKRVRKGGTGRGGIEVVVERRKEQEQSPSRSPRSGSSKFNTWLFT